VWLDANGSIHWLDPALPQSKPYLTVTFETLLALCELPQLALVSLARSILSEAVRDLSGQSRHTRSTHSLNHCLYIAVHCRYALHRGFWRTCHRHYIVSMDFHNIG